MIKGADARKKAYAEFDQGYALGSGSTRRMASFKASPFYRLGFAEGLRDQIVSIAQDIAKRPDLARVRHLLTV